MELFIFVALPAQAGAESAVEHAVCEVVGLTRAEEGCLNVHAFRSTRDPRLFYIHSRWTNEAAFENHAVMPHTLRFLQTVESLIDHALEVTRARVVG